MDRIKVRVRGARRCGEADIAALARLAAARAFFSVGPGFWAAVDITIVDDRRIRQINRDRRQVDKPTDVLSFPMLDFVRGRARFDPAAEARLCGGRVMLGDIVLSAERVRAQAARYGHSLARECAYLTVHGMLHLLGFDHENEEDRRLMRRREEAVMARLGLEREADSL